MNHLNLASCSFFTVTSSLRTPFFADRSLDIISTFNILADSNFFALLTLPHALSTLSVSIVDPDFSSSLQLLEYILNDYKLIR